MESTEVKQVSLLFQDTDQPIELKDCTHLEMVFESVMPGWPFQRVFDQTDFPRPFLTVQRHESGYRVSSDYSSKSRVIAEPVDVVCAVIAELAWATIDANEDWLCLHCAAIALGGGLVVFPAVYRSGKSTLSTILATKDVPLFTDDFLAIEINEEMKMCGVSGGVAPRLRRPWPSDLDSATLECFSSSTVASSNAYSYHVVSEETLVPRGERLPIRAFVLLERQTDVETAQLLPVEKDRILTKLIKQNFARTRNSAKILRGLHFLASNLPSYRLQYENAEEGADKIISLFGAEKKFSVPNAPKNFLDPFSDPLHNSSSWKIKIGEDELLEHASDIETYPVEDALFLADKSGYAIHKLDRMAKAIWELMERPISAREIVEILGIAFPDTPIAQIKKDVLKLLKKLLHAGLIWDTANKAKQTE